MVVAVVLRGAQHSSHAQTLPIVIKLNKKNFVSLGIVLPFWLPWLKATDVIEESDDDIGLNHDEINEDIVVGDGCSDDSNPQNVMM
eukprot:3400318-Amphidinium_carterae.1